MDLQLIPIFSLVIGFVLDALIGDPYHWPHPIKVFGNVISKGEKYFNQGNYRLLKGGIISVFLVTTVFYIFYLIETLLIQYSFILLIVNAILIFYGLANRTLIQEALKVLRSLETDGIVAGRKQLSFIVGRDTSNLSGNQIKIAVLETISENLSDGVIAPLFYYALGGVPLMFTYKMVNTLDSMIGYKNKRYKQFGLIAARIDDVVNYIPARITAFLMAIVSFKWSSMKYVFKYGHLHASPNAGYPEAALAGALNCRFGGPNIYHGKRVDKPYIGMNNRNITRNDVIKACYINIGSSILMLGLCIYYLQSFNFLLCFFNSSFF
jgi:adenosylcobinamide-phosphate synthase